MLKQRQLHGAKPPDQEFAPVLHWGQLKPPRPPYLGSHYTELAMCSDKFSLQQALFRGCIIQFTEQKSLYNYLTTGM